NAYALEADSEHQSTPVIIVTKGLLDLLRSRDELAFVLAHEMAHLRREHFSPSFPLAVLTSRQLARIAAVHRRWEHEADRDALSDLRRAGYATEAALHVLERLESSNESEMLEQHGGHPSLQARIAALGLDAFANRMQAPSTPRRADVVQAVLATRYPDER
ncbi:MAG: M48 family metallopeptidase, partial [Bdellovibrionales bacterium]|nr:M48 family metallopeptidase [Bdellovibrionales bacterium]